jgi:uncharacterized membrane protein HdeD (DUF308 family)
MSDQPQKNPKRIFWFSIVISVLLVVCGFLAILLPLEMSFGVVIVVSWLLMFSGVMQIVEAFFPFGWQILWKLLVGIIYLVTGFGLRTNPTLGIAALTLALLVFFMVHGVTDICGYLMSRKRGASAWMLVEGAVTLILALTIWGHWLSGSLTVLGVLVGLNMIVTGATRLMLALAARPALKAVAQVAV